ncbi:MAG: hypothetical protein QNJ70_32135 [Xenococcaceae cyanobacterium MO_207.B15]|nr:hypothetical protein [Xenococcaceae cyanobacterium MO_207.B15]
MSNSPSLLTSTQREERLRAIELTKLRSAASLVKLPPLLTKKRLG